MNLLAHIKSWGGATGTIQAFLVGVCLGIGFIAPSLWWFGVLAISWLIYCVRNVTSYRRLIWIGGIVWFVKSLCALVWFWYGYPIDWLGMGGQGVQISLVAFYWVSSSLWLGSGGVVFMTTARFLYTRSFLIRPLWYILLPFIWLGSEVLAALFFSLVTAGPGSFVQSYFSFGMMGYLLGTTSFGVWLAGIAGVYGLSIMMVTLGITLAGIIRLQSVKGYLIAAIFIISMSGSFLPVTESKVSLSQTTVIAIDTQFDAHYLADKAGQMGKAQTLKKAINEAVALQPDVIILPEDSRYLASFYDSVTPNQAMAYFQFLHGAPQTVLIDSGRYTDENNQTVLRATVFDGVGKKVWQFDKQYLVPQGEYFPFAYYGMLKLLGYSSVITEIAQDSSYRPGPLLQTDELPDYLPGTLFCFESVRPDGVTALQKSRTLPFIAHPISHGWFHTPKILWQQLDVMLTLQARVSGVPIVSAGNMVSGKLYLPNGAIETGSVVGSGERYQLRQFTF